MAEAKQVLVSYGDRKKVLKITPNSGLSDVKFLTRCFQSEFSFKENVSIVVTFQRYDHEWGEMVDWSQIVSSTSKTSSRPL